MLDLKFIRENLQLVRQNTENKNANADLDSFLRLDEERRVLIKSTDELKFQRNTASTQIAQKKKQKENADTLISEMKAVSSRIKEIDENIRTIEDALKEITLTLPNVLHESVPIGKSEKDNVELRRWGICKPRDNRIDHQELGRSLGLYDFERGAKISGSGFPVYTDKGARLERALINFFLDHHREQNGYTEIQPPLLVNSTSLMGTGQLPKFEEDVYKCQDDDLYLIPTAEVPLTNFHSNEILDSEQLPIKYCGYTACFRREAGSYGKDTRGFLRLHQFNKVELVKFARPDESYNELELLVADIEGVLQKLEIPYRVITLCSGDTGFSSAKTYDIEVWSAVEQRWLEVSSCSNFESFQARRAKIRYRKESGSKPDYVHTLNGSGLATPRLLVSLLDHNQTTDGRLAIPSALQSYCGFDLI